MIDGTNNHEYFSHKYNIPNETKEYLDFCGKYFKEIQSNKNFFKKDLNRNIFLFGKEKIKSLFLLSNLIKKNFKPNELIKNLSIIEDVSIPKFPITGEYLLDKGLKSGKKIPIETIRLLNIQKDTMVKQLIKFPNLYYTKSHFPLEISQRAFDHLWRICESYELWCRETKQEELIQLKMLD